MLVPLLSFVDVSRIRRMLDMHLNLFGKNRWAIMRAILFSSRFHWFFVACTVLDSKFHVPCCWNDYWKPPIVYSTVFVSTLGFLFDTWSTSQMICNIKWKLLMKLCKSLFLSNHFVLNFPTGYLKKAKARSRFQRSCYSSVLYDWWGT